MNAPVTNSEANALAVIPQQSSSLILNPALMQQMMAVAEAMANATVTVPAHFRGKPGDCLAVVMQATQWNMNPFAVAQKTHVVNGTLGYEAQLVHAVLQASGAIEGIFAYEYRGDGQNLECRVGAVCTGERERTWGEWLSIATVTTKNSPLWKTNPKQQIGYLQMKNWARAFKPGAILGVYTVDELEAPATEKFMGAADVVQPPAPTEWPADLFAARLPEWRKAIESKKATADAIVAKARTKYPLSEAQERSIREQIKTDSADADGVIVMSFAQVAERINKADNLDKLAEAASLISTVGNEGQRKELAEMYERRGADLNS